MRTLIQRVKEARVVVDGHSVGDIQHGILAYVGLAHDDDINTAKRMVDKLLTYRVFTDDAGKMGLNVQQVGGGLLMVSQFTLLANTQKGLRPDFKPAMAFDTAEQLFQHMTDYASSQYRHVAMGSFGADMQVHSVNDGPINFLLEQ